MSSEAVPLCAGVTEDHEYLFDIVFAGTSSCGKCGNGNIKNAGDGRRMREIKNEKQEKERENRKSETGMEDVKENSIIQENSKKPETQSIFGADEGKEPEITLSEEELDAMYARFCQRLQDQGLADAEGNPTEKTLQLRKKAVEHVEREKREQQKREMQKHEPQKQEQQKQEHPKQEQKRLDYKKRKAVKRGKTVAKAAGLVVVVGACVFGASMTSEANRIRLVETINGVRNAGDITKINNGEDRKSSAGSLEEAKKEIRDTLHIAVPEFYYVPEGMEYNKYSILQDVQMAVIKYQYNGNFVYFKLSANEKDLSRGSWKDREKVKIETLDDIIEVEMGMIYENNEKKYYAAWRYKDAYYQLSGQIEKEELLEILKEMQYNL